jgi:dTDP-4-dehydrorhamnose 3,5-epimerase
VLVPPNFANGHYVLTEQAIFFYKWSYDGEYPDVKDQFSILWNDPNLNINWPCDSPILSHRDKDKYL